MNPDQPAPPSRTMTLGDRGQVSGTITRASDGAPITKMVVFLETLTGDTIALTETSGNGVYSLLNVIPELYILRVVPSRRDSMVVPANRDINLKRGQILVADFALQEFKEIDNPPCMVQGTVVDSRSLELLFGVIISDRSGQYRDTTDIHGRFELQNLPFGSRDFIITKDGYVTNYRQEYLIPGEVKTLSLGLVRVAESKIVGPSGGVVEGEKGAFITIPPGALSQSTATSLSLLPMTDYFVGYTTTDVVDGIKILPDGLTFQQPVLVTLPLKEWLPADTEIPVAFFHSRSTNFTAPVLGEVTDDGRYVVFPLSRVDSYCAPSSNCRWVMVQGSQFTFTTSEVREKTPHFCENNRSWDRQVGHGTRMTVNTWVMIGQDSVELVTHYDFNWSHQVQCNSDWCQRHWVESVAYGVVSGYVQICAPEDLPPDADWLETLWLSEKRVRITSVTYWSGVSKKIEPCCDDERCESDDNLCTRDICQGGECVHPDNERGIACKRACKDCDPKTGLCQRYRCRECEKCEQVEPPIYGRCVPECITAADCPEPPDPCYRAICRSDGCCDQERLGDPPCDE
ncbi:hypothetical protein AMJ86_10580 [bacterium SM23_57]|nr:MAG: hypothetical protein AMJ86_10580 [bacterium SM23_57]